MPSSSARAAAGVRCAGGGGALISAARAAAAWQTSSLARVLPALPPGLPSPSQPAHLAAALCAPRPPRCGSCPPASAAPTAPRPPPRRACPPPWRAPRQRRAAAGRGPSRAWGAGGRGMSAGAVARGPRQGCARSLALADPGLAAHALSAGSSSHLAPLEPASLDDMPTARTTARPNRTPPPPPPRAPPELRHRQDVEALEAAVQRQRLQRARVAGRVDARGAAVPLPPQLRNVPPRPAAVDHDHLCSGGDEARLG